MKRVLILLAALGMLFGLAAFTSASAGASTANTAASCTNQFGDPCTQSYRDQYYPFCITWIPNAVGEAPDETCYNQFLENMWQSQIQTTINNGGRRLATAFEDINYNNGGGCGCSLAKLAVMTRRPGDGSGCNLSDGNKIGTTLMPSGWQYIISSVRLDDTYCRTALFFTNPYYGGNSMNCGQGVSSCTNWAGDPENDLVKSMYFQS